MMRSDSERTTRSILPTTSSFDSLDKKKKWTKCSAKSESGGFPWVTSLYCIAFLLLIGRKVVNRSNETGRQLATSMRNTNNNNPKPSKSTRTTLARKSTPQFIPDEYFTSQFREDRKLMEWFATLRDGTYLEVGSLDGITYSNSHAFHKGLKGWKGVLIELIGSNFSKMVTNRPDEIALIHAGVCNSASGKKMHYYNSRNNGAVAGVYEFAMPSFRERWWQGVAEKHLDHHLVHEFECARLDELLWKNAPQVAFYDFFSLDVVGGELSVLQTIDFDRVGFGIILVAADEHDARSREMKKLLASKGYKLWFEDEHDYWFAHEEFDDIYRDIIYYVL